MHHHHHVFRDSSHFVGKLFWTVVLVILLVVTIERGSLLGERGGGVRVFLGSIVLLYLPGYRITEAVWREDDLDLLEHTALSLAFSLSVVPLLVFYSNLLGMPITQYRVLGVVIVLLIVCIGRCMRNKKRYSK